MNNSVSDDDLLIPQYDGNITIESLNQSRCASNSKSDDYQPIPVIISERLPKPISSPRTSANRVIRYNSKKVATASSLPVLVNLNPRSIYKKKNEFKTMMDQLSVDCCTISESWDKSDDSLEKLLQMDGYQIIKNVVQRQRKGGKPVLVVKKEKYFIKELSPSIITVPPSVEASWALLTPKVQTNPEVKHIAVASIYYTKRTKAKDFIDHICEAYNLLLSKYGQGLHFIISVDFNRLNINPILALSPNLFQVVDIPTRTNPDATLDKIITTLSKFYLRPTSLPPLDNDEEGNGKPSDHLIIVMRPINQTENEKPKQKIISYRPLPESGMLMFKQWLQNETWQELYQAENAHLKAEILQIGLMKKLDEYLPIKTIKIRCGDHPWISNEIKNLDRKRKREYRKNKKSRKWKQLDSLCLSKSGKAKQDYSKNIVNDLKNSNQSQWYSKIKRMSSYNSGKEEQAVVQELINIPDEIQVEKIADQFSSISNLYSPLKKEDINLNYIIDERPPPEINPYLVYLKIMSHKKKTATVTGDIPMRVVKFCAEELSFPLCDIYTRAVLYGEYPAIYKIEIVTPVPKVFPPQTVKDLRKIAGTPNFSRIFETFLAEIMIDDMKPTRDPSQYGNSKGVSTQHYLIKMVDRILTALDTNNQGEKYAVVLQLVDWAQAFDRQCPQLGIESFLKNGVRKSVIPVLISYFQDRKMKVKWHNKLSTQRNLPGGGPQGSSIGGLEYDSQSNSNTDFLTPEDKYKFVDDLSMLEVINLITAGLASYNFKHHVASDIGVNQLYLPSSNVCSQQFMNNVAEWTQNNKMELNESKSKVMIFNYTRNYQFGTRIYLNNTILETITETRLLGSIVSSDLTWHKNSEMLTKKGYQRMIIHRNLYEFNIPIEDLVLIYTLYIRSILEYNSNVWFSSLSEEEIHDIERVQKIACKVILKNDYVSYEQALQTLNLQTLSNRRLMLAERFAKNVLKVKSSMISSQKIIKMA